MQSQEMQNQVVRSGTSWKRFFRRAGRRSSRRPGRRRFEGVLRISKSLSRLASESIKSNRRCAVKVSILPIRKLMPNEDGLGTTKSTTFMSDT